MVDASKLDVAPISVVEEDKSDEAALFGAYIVVFSDVTLVKVCSAVVFSATIVDWPKNSAVVSTAFNVVDAAIVEVETLFFVAVDVSNLAAVPGVKGMFVVDVLVVRVPSVVVGEVNNTVV